MRLQLSIRAMLLGLFGTAIVAALLLAAVALVSNARLVNTQDYILGEVLPNQIARTDIGNIMAGFGERHAELIGAERAQGLDDAIQLAELERDYQAASTNLEQLAAEDERAAELAASLDTGYGTLVDADRALEETRRHYPQLLE